MAQGDFTKEEAVEVGKSIEEIFDALPKTKQKLYVGNLNDIFLFLGTCHRNCPSGEAPKSQDIPEEFPRGEG